MAALQRLAARVVRFRLVIRMAIAVEEVARAFHVGGEIFGQTLARTGLRLESGRLLYQPAVTTARNRLSDKQFKDKNSRVY